MKWTPELKTGLWVGAAILVSLLLIDTGLLWRVIGGPINGWTFVSGLLVLWTLPTMAVVGYRVYDLTHLRYEFDRNQLVIHSAGAQQIIPTCNIERVIDGSQAALDLRMQSITWPGYFFGRGEAPEVGLILFYAVTPPSEQAIVVTPTVAYGISVDDMDAFIEVLTTCQELGPSAEVTQTSKESAYVHWHIWQDRLAQGILLGALVLNLALFGVLLFRYPRLPHLLPMHYDVTGAADRIAPRRAVFVLPVIGSITLAVNLLFGGLLYRRERIASYMAWGGAALVQVLFLVALWNIVD